VTDAPTTDGAERESPKDRAVVFAYEALERIGRALPERTGRALFTRVGRLAFHLTPETRAVVTANQAQVLGRATDDPLVRAAAREAYALYARYWVDSFHLPALTDEEVLARVRCETLDRIGQALEAGRGAIVALPHMGNWDAAGRWMAAAGYPVVAVAEELRPNRLFELFLEHRRALGMDIVALSGAGVGRRLGESLAANRVVALVADRDLAGRGVEVEMFGRKRRLPAGPALLSITTGAPLMVTPVYTTHDGWWIQIGEPLPFEPTGDRRADVTTLTTKMAARFEEAIAAAPADWHLFQPGWEP
jgi:phosphatidylinositol dimannoside acyltransferase